MTWAPRPYESTVLPRAVRRVGRKVPAIREHMRHNPFLDYATWLDLLSDHGSSRSIRYLTKNLTSRRAAQLLSRAGGLDVGSRQLSDIDLALAAWYDRHGVGETTGRRILASGLPHVSNVALRSEIPARLKERIARNAYRPNRLIWLSSSEADHLPDSTVWEVANAPETLEECAEGSMLDSNLQEGTLQYSALLLHVRAGLRDRAAASSSPRWLMAAAAVRLDPEQQQALVASCAEHWGGDEAEGILEVLSRHDYGYRRRNAPDPVGLLGSTPWCSPETWAHLEGRAGDGTSQTWAEDGVLLRRDALNDRDHTAIRSLNRRPHLDPATAAPEAAERWIEWAGYTSVLCAPYVLLELLANRALGTRVAKLRREALVRHSTQIREVLLRENGRYRPEQLEEPYHWRTGEPETAKVGTRFWALPKCPMPHALMGGDGGFRHLSEVGLTDTELETALMLASEFGGTVEELVEVVRAL